jgi:hypothetical protein
MLTPATRLSQYVGRNNLARNNHHGHRNKVQQHTTLTKSGVASQMPCVKIIKDRCFREQSLLGVESMFFPEHLACSFRYEDFPQLQHLCLDWTTLGAAPRLLLSPSPYCNTTRPSWGRVLLYILILHDLYTSPKTAKLRAGQGCSVSLQGCIGYNRYLLFTLSAMLYTCSQSDNLCAS